MRGSKGVPLSILDRHVQEGEEGRQGRPESRIQGDELAGELLADPPAVIAVVDLEVGPEQVTHGEVGGGLAVGDRAAFEDEPVAGVRGADELVDQTGLAYPGLPNHRHHLAVVGAGTLQGCTASIMRSRTGSSSCRASSVVMGSYRPLPEPPKFVSRAANVAKTLKLRTPAKLYI
jgi:hypothetical protein